MTKTKHAKSVKSIPSRKRRKSRVISLEEFESVMHLRQQDAANKLDVCLSSFKRCFAALKLKWPTPKQRKVLQHHRSLQQKLHGILQELGPEADDLTSCTPFSFSSLPHQQRGGYLHASQNNNPEIIELDSENSACSSSTMDPRSHAAITSAGSSGGLRVQMKSIFPSVKSSTGVNSKRKRKGLDPLRINTFYSTKPEQKNQFFTDKSYSDYESMNWEELLGHFRSLKDSLARVHQEITLIQNLLERRMHVENTSPNTKQKRSIDLEEVRSFFHSGSQTNSSAPSYSPTRMNYQMSGTMWMSPINPRTSSAHSFNSSAVQSAVVPSSKAFPSPNPVNQYSSMGPMGPQNPQMTLPTGYSLPGPVPSFPPTNGPSSATPSRHISDSNSSTPSSSSTSRM